MTQNAPCDFTQDASDAASRKLGAFFRALVARGATPEHAQRCTLQCAVALFAETNGLLPRGFFVTRLHDCLDRSERSKDVFEGLFRQLHSILPETLFAKIDVPDLTREDLAWLAGAAEENWRRIHPTILGTVFQSTMNTQKRHARGAHYTPEAAIYEYVVRPSLLDPLRLRLREAATLNDLLSLHHEVTNLRILDPACGSGNFLYVAYRVLKHFEFELLATLETRFSATTQLGDSVQTQQFFGLDNDSMAVELAKWTLWLAEASALEGVSLRPFDHFDANIRCADALLCDWPKANVILGNPPFQSKNKLQSALGPEAMQRVRARYPDVPGRADYCVYWFHRVHNELAPGGRAGLVGTNTIRQNDSRKGGLEYIVHHGGTITEAVSSMVWPSEAVVHVSVVHWTKGLSAGPKRLSWQNGDKPNSPWEETTLERIPASLSPNLDVTSAQSLRRNAHANACYQGQTHGHEGFLVSLDEAQAMVAASAKNRDVLHPFLIGDDLLGHPYGKPSRWVIDFHPRTLEEAQSYERPFQRVKNLVLPDRESAAMEEAARNAQVGPRGNKHHANFLKRWWLLSYPRRELMDQLAHVSRWIACSRVTKRPIFEFVSSRIHPNDALVAFPLEDDYSFGILQSDLHGAWFKARCSTLKGDGRYTSNTVFDSFPWPQSPTEQQCLHVAKAAAALRTVRRTITTAHKMSLRAMYTSMEERRENRLADAHAALDDAVRIAYGMPTHQDPLGFLLELNLACAARETHDKTIMGPGLPVGIAAAHFITHDAIEAQEL